MAQHVGHGTAGREARHVDAGTVRLLLRDDVFGQRGEQGGLSASALLVLGLEPVPALLAMGTLRLLGVEHDASVLARMLVHARARREIRRALGAAVEHQHQGLAAAGCAEADAGTKSM